MVNKYKNFIISYGTRPEFIKLTPLIDIFRLYNIKFKTVFSGQHENLLYCTEKQDTYKHDFVLSGGVMEHGQTLNKLISKIVIKMDNLFDFLFENGECTANTAVIIQGDTTTAYAIALSASQRKIGIIHLEAGLRTNNKYSPFPEELNRRMISQIADIHLCPSIGCVENLKNEFPPSVVNNTVFLVGNTIVDNYKKICNSRVHGGTTASVEIKNIINSTKPYIIVTLHRRENRGENMYSMWEQLNELSLSNNHNFVYITHPSLPESKTHLKERIKLINPINYNDMVHLISSDRCIGIISDSGGLQEEAVCAMKKILICRDTTERPETIECGLGKLIDPGVKNNIIDNISFLTEFPKTKYITNPYDPYCGVCKQILKILT